MYGKRTESGQGALALSVDIRQHSHTKKISKLREKKKTYKLQLKIS